MQRGGALLIIGLDIDGVLADFTRAYRAIAHDLHGVPIHGGGAQPTWHPHDLTDEQDAAVWAEINASGGLFWRRLDPVVTPGEVSDLNALVADGYSVAYVTARHAKTLYVTGRWLYEAGLPHGEVTSANNKVPVLTRYGEALQGFLDDSPHGVRRMHGAGLPVYVRDWPYNRQIVGPPRVGSVGEYLHRITSGESRYPAHDALAAA